MAETVVISGVSGSIGNFLAGFLVTRGYEVIGLDKSATEVDKLSKFYKVNLTDAEATDAVIRDIYATQRSVDGLINCAGRIHSGLLVNPFDESKNLAKEDFLNAFSDNVISTALLTSSFVKHQAKVRKPSSLINFSSISAFGNKGQSAYSAAKGAINGLTLTWAQELSVFKIRVNAIAPGFFATASTEIALGAALMKEKERCSLSGRLGRLDEIGMLCEQLLTNEYINGQIIRLDGGEKGP